MDLRPSNLETRRFFIGYKNCKCVRRVVGLHTIEGIPKKISGFLKLKNPKLCTGHWLHRSSATMLVENGGDLLSMKDLGGWQSSTVAEIYIEKSVSNRIRIIRQLFRNKCDENAVVAAATSSAPSNLNL